MKAVLISIQPKWCELIASGKKTIEVRKTRPKLETPFKCYIYCTLSGSNDFFKYMEDALGQHEALCKWNREKWGNRKGMVIGEFVCDKIDKYEWERIADGSFQRYTYQEKFDFEETEKKTCLKLHEIAEYLQCCTGYGWHISDLKIYDKPKEINRFYAKGFCEDLDKCCHCYYFHEGRGWLDGSTCDESDCTIYDYKPIWRAPQSYCYVEEL